MQKSLNTFLVGITAPLLLLALGSCGSDNATTTSTGPAPGAVPTVNIVIPGGAMNLGSDAFGQNPLPVAPGSKVIWQNNDTVTHDVVSDSGAFDTGPIAPGGTGTWTATPAGTYPYHCSIHPSMKGTLQVGPAASPSVTPLPSTSPGPVNECLNTPDSTPCGGEVCAHSCSGAPSCGSRVYHYCESGQCHGVGVLCTMPH